MNINNIIKTAKSVSVGMLLFVSCVNAQEGNKPSSHEKNKFIFGFMGGPYLESKFAYKIENDIFITMAPGVSYHTKGSAHFLQYDLGRNELRVNNGIAIDRDLLFSVFFHQPLNELKSHSFGCSLEKVVSLPKYKDIVKAIFFLDFGVNQEYFGEQPKGYTLTHPFGSLGANLYFDLVRSIEIEKDKDNYYFSNPF